MYLIDQLVSTINVCVLLEMPENCLFLQENQDGKLWKNLWMMFITWCKKLEILIICIFTIVAITEF